MSTSASDDNRVYIFDTTLRDGAQTQGVDFNPADKAFIARQLDDAGFDYVEGGWPGANPTDDAFFGSPPKLKRAKFTAFGMTRRPGRSAENDPGLSALINAKTAAQKKRTLSFPFWTRGLISSSYSARQSGLHNEPCLASVDHVIAAFRRRNNSSKTSYG